MQTLLIFLIFAGTPLILFASSAAAPELTGQNTYNLLNNSSSHPGPSIKIVHHKTHSKKHLQVSSTIKPVHLLLPPKHAGLSQSNNPQLRKLAYYEQVAGGALTNRMMIFTDIAASTKEAATAAKDMASTLKAFSQNGISPLVIMEPVINGDPVNFKNYRAGAYDPILVAYFGQLKKMGITDSSMGMWVYFPEANLPEWGPVDVADYAPNVARTVNLQKKYFPTSQSSILLDAMSYPAGSTSWDDGQYVNLSPFIKGIPKGTLDSFGMQGFPWVPPANQSGTPNLTPSVFLNSSIAKSAASQLGLNDIWLNSGTFATAYARSKSQVVTMSPSKRQTILSGITQQAKSLHGAGFGVSVNIFAEDKSNVAEAIDWSYKSAEAQAILLGFVGELNSSGIGFWLFDA